MSDTRSSFQVPARRSDGVSPDADEGRVGGGSGQAPADPGPDTDLDEEEAPTACWPVPDYAEPPTGPANVPAAPPVPDADVSRPRAAENDDPETFSFDRPAWDAPAPAARQETPPPPVPAWEAPLRPPVPAWEAPPASPAPMEDPPASGGFSYWERPRLPQASPPPPLPAWDTRPRDRRTGAGEEPPWDAPAPEIEDAPQAPPAKRTREPYLDNVKFLLIALVVTGHSLVPTLATHSARSAYLFIYVFHMPLFVIISGYLSRNFWNSNAKTNKLVDTFLVPYVVVEVGYAVLRFALGNKWSLTIIDPSWLNWYLLALLLWRLSTPVWKRMRYPLPIAIVVYLLAGLSDLPGDFSMDRFFGLMPFFVLGLWLQPHHFEMLNRGWVKILSVGVLAGAAAVAIVIAPHLPLDPVYYKDAYAELHLTWWMGMAMRAGLLVAALVVSAAILALVPRGNMWFSDLGTRTLYCYLLHGVPVLIAKEMGWLKFPWLHGPLGVMAITSSCFALAIVLCLPETRTVFKWLLEPRLTWLYRRPSAQVREAAR